MPDSPNNRKRIWLIAIFVVVCGFIPGVRDALFRELWFDEALTIGQFMELPTIGAVYRSYIIPNNHIIYTICLKLWNCLSPDWLSPDLYWRLFTVLTAAITVSVMFNRWRKRYGTITLALALFAFTCSLPFEIYATALRGYMLSMLWIVLALEFARAWCFKADWRAGAGYFVFCLLTVGTIPSNLSALAGIVIFLFPYFGFRKIFTGKFIYLALAPLAATALFYLPLSRNVAKILKLHEGWDNGSDVVRVVYSSFALAFLPVIIAAAAGGIIYLCTGGKKKFLWPLLIFLLPLPLIFVRSPAPFPRIFITLWPLWILLLCAGMKHFFAALLTQKKRLASAGILLTLAFAWGMFCHAYRAELASGLHARQDLDDFFSPYYMAPEYKPWSLIRKIKAVAGENGIPVYVSFNAEPYVLMLYGRMAGIAPSRWLFDNPRGKVAILPPGCWVLIKTMELRRGELENIKKRFGVKTLKPLFQTGVYSVFQVEN